MQEQDPLHESLPVASETAPMTPPDIETSQVLSQAHPDVRPPSPRPLHRAMAAHVTSLSEEALLALVLRTSSKRGGTPQTQAQRLLSAFGELRELARAGHAELADAGRIPIAKAAALSAAFELGRRSIATPGQRGQVYRGATEVYEQFGPLLSSLEQEVFWVLLLDQRNQLLRKLEILRGSVNKCTVMPVDIFAPAIREKAISMVLVHNHPSGDPEPSREDRSLTRRLAHIAELHAIQILDHVVIGDQRYVSFSERGWL